MDPVTRIKDIKKTVSTFLENIGVWTVGDLFRTIEDTELKVRIILSTRGLGTKSLLCRLLDSHTNRLHYIMCFASTFI